MIPDATVTYDAAITSQLVHIGISHKTAPADVRGVFAPDSDGLNTLLDQLSSRVDECFVLATCGRFEIYAHARSASLNTLRDALSEVSFCGTQGLSILSETTSGEATVRHLLRVAAGLESQIIGEPHILGQVRVAFQHAIARHSIGPNLHALCRAAIHCGKRVRHETAINPTARSFASMTADHVAASIHDLRSRTILVLGSGKLAGDVTRAIATKQPARIVILGRNRDRAKHLATQVEAECHPLALFPKMIAQADATLVCTAAREALIHRRDVVLACNDHLMIDLSVPRNVCHRVGNVPGVQLLQLDDLVSKNPVQQSALSAANAIVAREMKRYLKWRHARQDSTLFRMMKDLAA